MFWCRLSQIGQFSARKLQFTADFERDLQRQTLPSPTTIFYYIRFKFPNVELPHRRFVAKDYWLLRIIYGQLSVRVSVIVRNRPFPSVDKECVFSIPSFCFLYFSASFCHKPSKNLFLNTLFTSRYSPGLLAVECFYTIFFIGIR